MVTHELRNIGTGHIRVIMLGMRVRVRVGVGSRARVRARIRVAHQYYNKPAIC